MKFSKLLKYLLAPFFMFAVDGEGGGATDRGDDFAPTDDDAEADADAAAEITRIEAEKAAEKIDPAVENTDPAPDGEDKGKDKKDALIPLARHKAMLDKSRAERDALVAENERLKQGTQLSKTNENIDATETKLVSMEEEYNELLGKGELKDAAKLMTDIRRMERTISDAKADFKAQAASNEAYERVKYDTVVSRIEDAYPQLNPDHDDYDDEKAVEVMDLFSGFVKNGLDRAAALQKAVKYAIGSATNKQQTAVEVDPRVTADQLAKERKAAGLKRNVGASQRQPADVSKVGLDSDKGGALTSKEAMKMNQKDFAKLSEADLSRMRGDTL